MSQEPRIPQTIPLSEAAERLGFTVQRCRDLIRRKEFCAVYRISRRDVRVDPNELADWMAARRVDGAAELAGIRRPGFGRRRSDGIDPQGQRSA